MAIIIVTTMQNEKPKQECALKKPLSKIFFIYKSRKGTVTVAPLYV